MYVKIIKTDRCRGDWKLVYMLEFFFFFFFNTYFLLVFFRWGHVIITKLWQMEQENMTMEREMIPNVTVHSMAGIASKELQEQKWWPHVHRRKHVIRTFPSGWEETILLWLRVKSGEKSAFTRIVTVANAQSSFKLRTAAPTISTSCITQGFVTPVTTALTNPVTNDLSVKPMYCVTAVRLLPLVFFLCDC